jgi:hypothetical protein
MESAKEYLLRSANELTYEYLHPDVTESPWGEEGYPFTNYFAPEDEFAGMTADRVSFKLIWSPDTFVEWGKYSDHPVALVVTPCSVRGPFTVSVFYEFEHVGWLEGDRLEDLATRMVEEQDYGTALVLIEDFKWVGRETGHHEIVLPVKNPNAPIFRSSGRIISQQIQSTEHFEATGLGIVEILPSGFQMFRDYEWVHAAVFSGNEFPDLFKIDDVEWLTDGEIELIPNVWDSNTVDVFVYFRGKLIGAVTKTEDRHAIYQHLTRENAHRCGEVKAYEFIRHQDGSISVNLCISVRPVHRIEWQKLAAASH